MGPFFHFSFLVGAFFVVGALLGLYVTKLLIRMRQSAAGGTRPMPQAAEEGPPPAIGLTDQPGPDLTADKRRPPEETEVAEAPAPGFSL